MLRYYVLLFVIGSSVAISGCTLNRQPNTPADQEAQEEMMRHVLQESSPRNMSDHPKVTPEFRKTFNTRGSRASGSDQSQSSQDISLTKQSEEDEES